MSINTTDFNSLPDDMICEILGHISEIDSVLRVSHRICKIGRDVIERKILEDVERMYADSVPGWVQAPSYHS